MRTRLFLSGLVLALVSQTACTISPYQWQLISFYITGWFLTVLKFVFNVEV